MSEKSFDGQNELTSQAETWAPLTPSNSVNFSFIPKAICVGAVSGSFVAVGEDDEEATFYGNAGQLIQIRPKRINTTGLTGGMTFVGLKT
jgi:hypothetical protein